MLERVTVRILDLISGFKRAGRHLISAFFPEKAVK
jgi:hypothetical protein